MTKHIHKIYLLITLLLTANVMWGKNLPAAGGNISGTYDLTTNVTLNSGKSFTVAAGTTATINLNGKTINGNGARIFVVHGTLNINGSGIIQNGNSNLGGCAYVYDGGTFNINGGTIQNCSSTSHGGAIYVTGGGQLNMTGGTIQNNKTNIGANWSYPAVDAFPEYGNASGYGGGVYLQGNETKLAKFNMTGGNIFKNVAASGGGVMVFTHSEFIMNGANAKIEGNIACGVELGNGLGNGGAVYVQSSKFHLKKGSLIGNKAKRYGGAVNTNQSANFIIEGNSIIDGNYADYGGGLTQEAGYCQMTLDGSGVIVKNNKAKYNGGGLMIEKGILNIKGATIQNNSAGGSGGGASLYVSRIQGDIEVNITDNTLIDGNTAVVSGGGLDLYAFPIDGSNADDLSTENQPDNDSKINSLFVNFNSGTLDKNIAPLGAGINLSIRTTANHDGSTNAATVNLGTNTTTPTISNNIASNNGGGIAMNSGVFNILNASLSSNSATNNGGGIFLGDGTFKISGSTNLNSNGANYGGGIYIGDGTLTVTDNGSIGAVANHVTNDGGAIYLAGGNMTSTGSTEMTGNYSANNGGAIFVSGGNISLKSPSFTGNGKNGLTPSTKNGGAIYLIGTGKNFTSTGTSKIENNASTVAGGALYVSGGSVNMAASTLSGNYSANGGAAYVSNGSFTTTGTTSITGNYATTDGGAVYVSGGTVSLNNPTISGNGKNGATVETDNGGAIYSTGTVTVNGTSTIENNAAKNGGAIYATGNVTFKGNSTFTGNSAVASDGIGGNGGAIYVDGGNIATKDGSTYYNVTASGNSAVNGGVFYAKGSIELGYTVMENNSASNNGGAVALYNGTFGMQKSGTSESSVSKNTATNYGGGLYMENTSSTAASITWNGGIFSENTAKAGGAVTADGKINLTFAATMENNKAEVGGGLYLNNGVDMTFGAGLIRSNKAEQPSTNTTLYTTASGKDANSVSGVGGGIFMAGSKLTFSDATELGIYNNSATNAGADICANGSNTSSITLPNVSGMKLRGFDVPATKLYWMEDYFADETYTSNVISGNSTGVRYEHILANIKDYTIENYMITIEDGSKTFTGYLCLDLGYDLIYVKLNVSGLNDGDAAAIICKFPSKVIVGEYETYRKILFTGNSSSDPVQRQVALPSGNWKFETSDLSVGYNDPTYTKSHSLDGDTPAAAGSDDIFISNEKDGNSFVGYDTVNATFTASTGTSQNAANVKQFSTVKVNRMQRTATNN